MGGVGCVWGWGGGGKEGGVCVGGSGGVEGERFVSECVGDWKESDVCV